MGAGGLESSHVKTILILKPYNVAIAWDKKLRSMDHFKVKTTSEGVCLSKCQYWSFGFLFKPYTVCQL